MPRRDLGPVLWTAAVAAGSAGLLTAAVRRGWLGPDVGRGAAFCEAARDALVRQPANAWSNVGFVLAGLAIAWRAGDRDTLGAGLRARPGLATSYACLVVLLGPASAAMHATGSVAGGLLDLTSMYLVAAFASAYALTRWWRRGTLFFWQLNLLLVAACELVGTWERPIPVVMHAGNLAFGTLLLLAVVVEARLWRRGVLRCRAGYGLAALAAMLVAFAIWNVSQSAWCAPHSLWQGHAAWHLLCAVAAYCLYRLYASEDVSKRP